MVDRGAVIAFGTRDYEADARLQRSARAEVRLPPGSEVYGELILFGDPSDRLAALDALEGYSPEGPSLYERVLIPVEGGGETRPAWTYAISRAAGTLLPDGRWPA